MVKESPTEQVRSATDEVEDHEILEDPVPERIRALTTTEAAARLQMSPAWVKLHAREIGGRWTPRGYRFPAEITIETVQRKITFRHTVKSRGILEQESHVGDVARQVFAALDAGTPTRMIVQELRIPPETVLRLAEVWIKCGRFDETALAAIHGKGNR